MKEEERNLQPRALFLYFNVLVCLFGSWCFALPVETREISVWCVSERLKPGEKLLDAFALYLQSTQRDH